MSRLYRHKKIWLNEKHTKYCIVRLYREEQDMQDYYDKMGGDPLKQKVAGASLHYEKISTLTGKIDGETGVVLLCMDFSGAGVVTHELMHAVLWAHRHKKYKKQHPIIIKNMKEEELILSNHTHAVTQFYRWYWKIEKEMK